MNSKQYGEKVRDVCSHIMSAGSGMTHSQFLEFLDDIEEEIKLRRSAALEMEKHHE